MLNPYHVLNVSQNVTKKEIIKAFIVAVKNNKKTKKYQQQEIMLAQKQLLKPDKRLVADFLFPAKVKTKRPTKLNIGVELKNINLDSINENTFDTL